MTRLLFTEFEFDTVLYNAHEFYRTLDRIRCPYFRDGVQFNAQGLEHLRRKSWNRGRSRSDQLVAKDGTGSVATNPIGFTRPS